MTQGTPFEITNYSDPNDVLLSYFGRLNYDYDSKYLFSGTFPRPTALPSLPAATVGDISRQPPWLGVYLPNHLWKAPTIGWTT